MDTVMNVDRDRHEIEFQRHRQFARQFSSDDWILCDSISFEVY